MKLFFSILVLAFTSNAFSHVKVGTYRGVDSAGKECSFEVMKVEFAGGVRNPLNERVFVRLDSALFELRHQPSISDISAEVGFEHEILRGANGTETGANSLSVFMTEAEGYEGPGRFVHNAHNWQTKQATSLVCNNLRN